jgi:hypothetical protein
MKLLGLAITVLTGILPLLAFAQDNTTKCLVLQYCPMMYCPSVSTDNKAQIYQQGCLSYAQSQGATFINYSPGTVPQCEMIISIPSPNFDCKSLK